MTTLTNVNLMVDFLNNKHCREILCRNYVSENPLMTDLIIRYWSLGRIEQKYISESRQFNENSYSKRKVKEEEIIFCRKHSVLQPLRYYFEEQRKLNDILFAGLEMHENDQADNEIYRNTVIKREAYCDYPKHPFVVKKNNRVRMDLTMEIVEIPEIRERCINEYLTENEEFIRYVIKLYNLKFIKYKYLDKTISKYESSYTRNKIKLEELFLLNKTYQFSVWFRRMEVFWDLQENIFSQQLIDQESRTLQDNNLFVEYVVENIIEQFRTVDFDLADDINFN